MKEYTFGNLNRHHLLARFWYTRWNSVFNLKNYSMCISKREFSGRCYCPGFELIIHIGFGKLGASFWYSIYSGEVPCSCDEALSKFLHEK